MKGSIVKLALVLGIAAGSVGAAQADSSPTGLWRVSTFNIPGGASATVQTVCLKADHTWYSTSQPHWNGSWFQNGQDVHWYGGIPISGVGNVASMAMGKLDSPTTMSGQYAEWTAPGTPPLTFDRHFTYSMVFLQAECPPAKQ
ncbi:hypothetical protein [Pseudomonas rubra]|uniref:Avidin family protein n=1 Tax=Pseudomonas rubra TaxID=2942627 RepID=A0ABT5P8R0_9PSED|nr:hypothetical protein [Pseudomonas rubra]MDD1014648.1 hypothetical protein [Pseudomonas rubra]MDD1041379.1 hypothetical protein [Pseudomonas rubra]MDD1155796.1 hypothetical protein [Pseudomonas rubra]